MKNLMVIATSALAIGAISYWGLTVLVTIQDVELSTQGKIAMVLGILFTLGIGIGLMSLAFYSNKHGHDESVYHSIDQVDEDGPAR